MRSCIEATCVADVIDKPQRGTQHEPCGEACDDFWQGGGIIKGSKPQSDMTICQLTKYDPGGLKATRDSIKETCVANVIGKLQPGSQPEFRGHDCYGFWQGGDIIKITEPQSDEMIYQLTKYDPCVVKALRNCLEEKCVGSFIGKPEFGANIRQLPENCAYLVDGYMAKGTASMRVRRKSLLQHPPPRGPTTFMHTKISRIIRVAGIRMASASLGRGDLDDEPF